MNVAYKLDQSRGMGRERLHIKAFKSWQEMESFLNKQTDNSWRKLCNASYPQKTGVYAFARGQWHNVKSLDSSVLAHV